MTYKIMVLNTGSTSTKMAVYFDDKKVLQKEFEHTKEFLEKYPYMSDQLPMRQELADEFTREASEEYGGFDAIVARGGILPPLHAGGYEINDVMVDYLLNVCAEEHASNVAACIAFELRRKYGIPHAYIYDGISTDELEPVARVSGIPDMPRVSVTHCLNMRATAHRAASDIGKSYAECTFIVAHLGGGISMSLHKNGLITDVVGDDEGPFSPERAGGQQVIQLIKYLVRKNKTDMRDKLRVMRGDSGLFGYFGTSDARRVEKMIAAGDERARLVYEAMALQIAKYIAGLAASVRGRADAIILTGGLAHSKLLTEEIISRIGFIAPVRLYPGENEMESLAHGALRILKGEESARSFRYDG
ncbi:MAG: butyrate kinase [Synergistaceae bacterium]|nr:butyrate kinase [Synergistaceae bacterium]